MLPVGLIILVVMLALGAPPPAGLIFAAAWIALWIIWTWLKIWAVRRTGDSEDKPAVLRQVSPLPGE